MITRILSEAYSCHNFFASTTCREGKTARNTSDRARLHLQQLNTIPQAGLVQHRTLGYLHSQGLLVIHAIETYIPA